jgi:hypothetical protein
MRLRAALLVPALVLASAAGLAHVPLVHPSNGTPLTWSTPSNIGIVINSTGSDDITDGSHETALRLAIEEWNAASGTTMQLVEDTTPAQQARTDWQMADIHLITFDETNASGYFPFGSGTVAVTPVWFFSNGVISDADILFNGSGFQFTTSAEPGRFDVGDVATHELGHLVGLDHSAWAGATMYPFVDPSVILHRSLSEDEVHGMRAAYPMGAFGRITGLIRRASDASAISGAHVVACGPDGRTTASVLTAASGSFTISGLDPGAYTVYAAPLGDGSGSGTDAPVDASNLSSWFTIETDFQAGIYPGQATITAAETIALGPLDVGADIALNLGTEQTLYPIRIVAGSSRTIVVRGTGLLAASTLEASDTDFIVGTPMWFGSQVSFQLTVPPGEAPGHVDLMVTNSFGERSILTGALEVTPASPVVASVLPDTGSIGGGTALTVTGTGFGAGARVVVGDQIYTDGVNGTTVASPTSIMLTTTATVAGTHDVVVVDATGVEGRLASGFTVMALPTVATVFPPAGQVAGGTAVVLTGTDFAAGATVRIDGVDQSGVVVESASRIRFSTGPGSAGPQLLEVENPGGGIATSAFTFDVQADPSVVSADPSSVAMAGGETITIAGAGFTGDTEVIFGVDPDTGAGGTASAGVTFVDASTLEVVTPVFAAAGTTSVLARDTSSGQADVLTAGFSVAAPAGGGGGGGCYTVPVAGPPTPRSIAVGGWWMLLLMLALGARARNARASATH